MQNFPQEPTQPQEPIQPQEPAETIEAFEEVREKKAQEQFESDLQKEARQEVYKLEQVSEEEGKRRKTTGISKKLLEKLRKAKSPEEILSAGLDTLGSLEFLEREREKLLKEGYRDSPLLNTYLGLAVISRRMRISLELVHKQLFEISPVGKTEDIELVQQLEKLAITMSSLKSTLDKDLERKMSVDNVVELHKKTLIEAEEFLKSHLGEFALNKDVQVLDMQGKAHWAFAKMKGWDEKTPLVWSEEGAYLIRNKLITPETLAFILRTSPEGLQKMAEIKGEKLEFSLERAEEALRKIQDEFGEGK